MKDFKSILLILLSFSLISTLGLYFYDKSQSYYQIHEISLQDSIALKKAILKVINDSLQANKNVNPQREDTVYLFKDSSTSQIKGVADTISFEKKILKKTKLMLEKKVR